MLFKCSSYDPSFILVEWEERQQHKTREMELQDTAASRVSIGFPLGMGLLFACLLFICGFFCCCLHWKKFRSLFQSSGAINPQTQIQADSAYYPQKPAFPVVVSNHLYMARGHNYFLEIILNYSCYCCKKILLMRS